MDHHRSHHHHNINIHISMLLITPTVTIPLLLLLLTTNLPTSLSQSPLPNSLCSQNPYKCGGLPDIYYPFWGQNRPRYCGGGDQFHLTCDSDHTSIQMASQNFEVVDIKTQSHTMTMLPLEYNVCSPQFNFSLGPDHMIWYAKIVFKITVFYDCPSEVSVGTVNNFTCQSNNKGSVGVYHMGVEDEVLEKYPELKRCRRRMQVPGYENAPSPDGGLQALYGVLRSGFQVNYAASQECLRCMGSEGVCGTHDNTSQLIACYCAYGSNAFHCSKSNRVEWKRKVIIGVIGGVLVPGLILIFIGICWLRCNSSKSRWWQDIFWWSWTNSNKDIEAFLKNNGALTLKRYKFSDVKKMTHSFKFKLGQGGFGVVYKGKLLNGLPVAVKILNPSKGNNDDFINEVTSISRTSHVNVVTLLGFCLEGRRKALIYEYMSNGSLEKFISNKKGSQIITPSLSWDKFYQIAVGIARGLEYLHRGCSTRILHFDIKPYNILLDENFCPKISDFGLSKLCIKKESIISMSDARGTIGYIAPEVWNRHLGGASHKSDVYSYGMMLLEIVGGTTNNFNNGEASHSSEIYFPDWIYRRLEQGTDLRHDGEEVAIEENDEVVRKMTIVGLWCIQTFPNDRPKMSRVLEMLECTINSLEMPPKPVLSSPIRSIAESTL